ncbi:unnamed protein product [Leptidea sinapis]|uniref:Hepatocyte growth factor-regulated tyrosine kinase substrate n=1 Tax=Leptidea sinapis TaxID=189913 RepID=A0A5E4Q4C2_9NEOP|nr:unnamed protein product [Leptidea sinapis]
MFRANNFDKLLEKATCSLRLDPDWPSILQICDLIRQNDCSPKYAVAAVKKKLYSQNPHQAMFALLTLESIVKNCGSGVHDEVTSKAFCEMLRDLVKTTAHENLKSKILELIQAWGFAFRNNPKYRAVQDTVNILKAEGFKFPPLKESDAMFSADTAPEWADGEVCHRCRVAFSLMVRRHHCRACGQVFCQQCSSKTSTLPKFGIEKEVRVCDACFDKASRPPSSTAKIESVDTSSEYGAAQPQKRPGKSAEELQEEEELQLALALSQSEAEQKEKEKERRSRAFIAPEPVTHPTLSPTPSSVSASPEHSTVGNPELSRYLDRNYWEQRLSRDSAAPTAPSSHGTNDASEDFAKPSTAKSQEDEAVDKEVDDFVETLKAQVEIFVNRMKSNSSRGRSIANDTSVQTLFMNITAMHSKLLKYIQQQDDKRVYLESLQDKISQVRDSRAALDTLRAEHVHRLAQAAEAAERQRQMQMATKLQAMRKKKHEYLQYQRQLALQRVQEQEREMQMRQEQQKHQYMMSSTGFYMPGVSMHQFQPGFPTNQMMYTNPYHAQIPQTTDGSVSMPGQAQVSQANVPLNMNPMGSISVPQANTNFAMSTSGVQLSQAPPTIQGPMSQQNMRPNMGQMPMQQQQMMMQMQQMRLQQPGVHQMMTQNMPNGPPPQNASQQVPKQMPNQNQPNMMPPMTMAQPHQANPNNPMYNMSVPNMRMSMMQNQPNNPQIPVSYPMNAQNPQASQQTASMPQMVHQSMPPHTMSMQNPTQQMPPGQQPQMTQHQSVPMPGQPQFQNPQMMPHGQIPQNQLPNQGQNIHPTNMMPVSMPQQIHQAHMQNMHVQGPQNMQAQPPQNIQAQVAQNMQAQPQNTQAQVPQNMQAKVPQNMQAQSTQKMQTQATQNLGPQNMQTQGPQNIPATQNMPQGPQSLQNQQNMTHGMQQGQVPVQSNMRMPSNMQQQGQNPNMQGQMKAQQNFANTQNQQPASNQTQTNQQQVKPEPNNNAAELISFD